MYGVPDPHSLLRPWKNLREFSEELFALLRPVGLPQADEPEGPARSRYESNVGEIPEQPNLISPDYSATFNESGRSRYGAEGGRTMMPRRQQSYDTARRQQSAPTADWERRTYPFPADEPRRPAVEPQEQQRRSQPQFAELPDFAAPQFAESPPARPYPAVDHSAPGSASPFDATGIDHDIAGFRQQAKIAGIQLPGSAYQSFLASTFYAAPPVVTGQANIVGPPRLGGPILATNFYSPPSGYVGSFLAPPFVSASLTPNSVGAFAAPQFYAPATIPMATHVPGAGLDSVVPFVAPWIDVAPMAIPYFAAPPTVVQRDLFIRGVTWKKWFEVESGPYDDWPPIPWVPFGAGGGGGTVGKVVSGTGDTYQVVLYSLGPDNASDNQGRPVEVKILQIDPDEEIPVGTWLFGILQLENEDGDPAYYAQPPIWLS